MVLDSKLLVLFASAIVCSAIAFSQPVSVEASAEAADDRTNTIVGEIGGSKQCKQRPLREYATKIMRGDVTAAEYWPGIVALGAEKPDGSFAYFNCGGVLLDERNVLTAAHCLDNSRQDSDTGRWFLSEDGQRDWPLIAIANSDDLAEDSNEIAARVVGGEIIDDVGARYFRSPTNQPAHDIAILRLDREMNGPYATLSGRIDADPAIEGHLVWAAGFGTLDSLQSSYEFFDSSRGAGSTAAASQLLRDVILQFKPRNVCARKMGHTISDMTHICAGWDDDEHDTCAGDSGGPLSVLDVDGCPVVVGLTSYGPTWCGSPGTYGVYTRVSQYHDWIKERVPAAVFAEASPPAAGQEAFKRMVDTVLEYGANSSLELNIKFKRNGIEVEQPLIAGNQYEFIVTSPIAGNLMIVDRNESGFYDLLFPSYPEDEEAIGPGIEISLPLDASIDDQNAVSEEGSLTLFVLPETVDIRSVFLAPSKSGTRKLYPAVAFRTGIELSNELEEINDLLDLKGGDAQVVATEFTYEFVR